MNPEKQPPTSIIVEDNEMETVELHRANSIPGQWTPSTKEQDDLNAIANTNISSPKTSRARLILSEIRQMKVEVVMFLYMFSYLLRAVSSTTMIMDKVCQVHLGHTELLCSELSHKENAVLKSEVEKMANNYSLGHTLIQLVPSAVLACFFGSWSDKYGRKFPIIVALVGIIIDGIGTIICASIFSSRIEYYFIPAIFTGFSGGFIGVLTVLYSYASDITTFTKRTLKYAFMEMAFGLAMPLGQVTGGILFKTYGYVPVFVTSAAGHMIALAWVVFMLKETRGLDNKDSWNTKIRNFFSFKSVVEGFKATTRRRPNKGKEQILALMLAMSIGVMSYASTASINFLYVHHVYDWGNTQFSIISAVFAIFSTIAMLVTVSAFKKFNVGDPTMGIVGSVSLFIKLIGMGLATHKWVFFLANLLGIFQGLGSLAGRSRISKVTSKDDLGKVFAFLTSAESIVPILSTAVVSQIFNATLNIYAGIVYLVLGCLTIITILIFIWLARLPAVNYEEMHNNSPEEHVEPKVKT